MLGLRSIRRLWRAPARQGGAVPDDVVVYEGRIRLDPGEWGESLGCVILEAVNNDFVSYLYEQLEVPDKYEASFLARITVEVFPDPDMANWPDTN